MRFINNGLTAVQACRIPDGSEAEGHEQQDGHDAHGSLVVRRVAALKDKQTKLSPLRTGTMVNAVNTVTTLTSLQFVTPSVRCTRKQALFPPQIHTVCWL